MSGIRFLVLALMPLVVTAQSSTSQTNSLDSLRFLEGTWRAQAQGTPGVTASGRYVFQRELSGHILARHSTSDPNCKGPATFDCEHRDLLYVFQDGEKQPLKAIYFDSEGHTIRYDVRIPNSNSVVFESESAPGPRFRLTYELKSGVMSGKFQVQAPGTTEWRSYMEWAGARE